MKNVIVTRLAPSPTSGFLHLGNVRTLLYNYFLAKQSGEGSKFLVRLEDTDRDRYNPDFLKYFRDTLDWLGIVPDASYWNPDQSIGSFIQSERDYSNKLKFLLDSGLAYYAFDTKEDLDRAHKSTKNFKYDSTTRLSMRNSLTMTKSDVGISIDTIPYVIRFAVPSNLDVTFTDAILGDITINSNTIDDKVLLKSNGVASYTLANVCDDHDMGVTHVLRGQEWVPSTPCHILLYKAFGWNIPSFSHLPLIMNPDGRGKLSKRTAAKFGVPIAPLGYVDSDGVYQKGWKDLGYDPKAFMNALSLIGWNPGHDVEIMSMDDMIKNFSLDRVHKSGARFDMDKAKWINSQYLKNTPNSCLLTFVNIKDNRYSDDKLDIIMNLAKDRSDFKCDLDKIVSLFFNDPIIKDFKFDDNYNKVMKSFIGNMDNVDFNNIDDIKSTISAICDGFGIKMGKVMPGLRASLVNFPGPDLMTTMMILGKDGTKSRISKSFNLVGV